MAVASPMPTIESSDSGDTRWALQTAMTLWGQGERREALQWVRRAAEAAAEAGQDDRALVLAKAGAELRAHLEIPRTLPPPPKTPEIPPPEARGDGELVVTVVSTDGTMPAPDASLVSHLSHRAVRVAVLAAGANEVNVKILSPGEVAPQNATVALLVAFEPGVSPVPGR
jgi:hypothetical protein